MTLLPARCAIQGPQTLIRTEVVNKHQASGPCCESSASENVWPMKPAGRPGRDRFPLATYRDTTRSGTIIGQLATFSGVTCLTTVAYVALYLLTRTSTDAVIANSVALLLTSVANTAINRNLAFRVSGRAQLGVHHSKAIIVMIIGVGLTDGALWLLSLQDARPSRSLELAVLVSAKLVVAATRFSLFRWWVFRPRESAAEGSPSVAEAVTSHRGSADGYRPKASPLSSAPSLPT